MHFINRSILFVVLALPMAAFAANTLTWDLVPGATTIHIERKNVPCGTSGAYSEIGTAPGTAVTYTDPSNSFDVCYRIAASNVNGKSGYSNEAGKLPSVPANLQVQ
jgi:hypothetical protein